MKQGVYLDGVKKRLLSTEGILTTITTMGNMFLHMGQVIDFRVQRGPTRVEKLWNVAAIISINVMNKSSWFYRKATSSLPLCYLHNWPVFTNIFSRIRWPKSDLGGNVNDRNERKTI